MVNKIFSRSVPVNHKEVLLEVRVTEPPLGVNPAAWSALFKVQDLAVVW